MLLRFVEHLKLPLVLLYCLNENTFQNTCSMVMAAFSIDNLWEPKK